MNSAAKSQFVYVTYIRTTPERLWEALTSAEFTKQYWFGVVQKTDWKVGSSWSISYPDGTLTDTGEVLEFEPYKRIVLRWRNEFKPEWKAEGDARCVMELEPVEGAVKLTITHGIDRANSKFIGAVSGGWPKILANLKSLLETGSVILK
jgi:uncharacterized protein YndB with AHSA1/START domain